MKEESIYPAAAVEEIKNKLTSRKQTIAVAESVTAGLLQNAMSSAVEASTFFQGGITCYNVGQKCRHLAIDPIHGISCDCVSEKMAQDMAIGCALMFTSDWAIAITGYASPVPQSNNKLYAFFAVVNKGKVVHTQKLQSEDKPAAEVQLDYTNTILEAVAKLL